MYSISHYVIKFVSDLQQVGGFLWVLWFLPPIKLTATIKVNVESGIIHHRPPSIVSLFASAHFYISIFFAKITRSNITWQKSYLEILNIIYDFPFGNCTLILGQKCFLCCLNFKNLLFLSRYHLVEIWPAFTVIYLKIAHLALNNNHLLSHTVRHDITEKLLKVALNTTTLTLVLVMKIAETQQTLC